MDFTYDITQDNYLFIIEYLLRQKAKKRSKRVGLFLLTWGQTAVVALILLLFPLTRPQQLLLAALSLLTTLFHVVYSRAYRFKARFLLSGLLSAGQYSPDFWGTHHLSRQDGQLLLSYGQEQHQLPAEQVCSVAEDPHFFYILGQKGEIWEAVPRDISGLQRAEELWNWIKAS